MRSFVSNDDKKILAETAQLLENVLEQLSKLSQMRKKVPQVKGEILQELSKENGKDNDKLIEFAEKFYRLDAAVQLLQSTRSLGRPRMQRLPKVVWRSWRGVKLYPCLPGDTDPAWRIIGEDAPV